MNAGCDGIDIGFASLGYARVAVLGLVQAAALIPGASRSGATMTAALMLGFRREEPARFSFLPGVPAIFFAGAKELRDLARAPLDAHGWAVLAVDLACGSFASFAAIWGLMRFLERVSTWPFVLYRVALGTVVLWQTTAPERDHHGRTRRACPRAVPCRAGAARNRFGMTPGAKRYFSLPPRRSKLPSTTGHR